MEERSDVDLQERRALRARRRHLGFTQRSLAEAIDASTAAVGNWERGLCPPLERYRAPLCEALDVTMGTLDYLLDPRSEPLPESVAPTMRGHPVPRWLNHFQSLVLACSELVAVERILIYDLLQTARYAYAIERHGMLPLTHEQAHERVELRARRQNILFREPDPLKLTVYLHEGTLSEPPCDQPGIRDVMVEQLDYLLELNERPNVDIHILPANGRAAPARAGFEVLHRDGERSPFMIVHHELTVPRYVEDADMERWLACLDYVAAGALTPVASTANIKAIRETQLR
jgi:transcriptional regulator with XRE-family HTH domain